MLLQYAFHNEDRETSRGALRVLANSMLLKPHTRQTFIDKDYAPVACSKLNTDSWDDEFLLSRVLFLSTYGTANFKDLVQKHDIGESIGANLGRHEAAMSSKAKENAMMENMALDETLRLLFNITHFCPDDTSEFASAVSPVVALLWRDEISSNKPLGGVPGHLINALLNLDLKDPKHHDALFSREDPSRVASRLIELLGAGLKSYNEQEIGASLPPLVHVLERVYEQAPDDVKKIIRDALLPSDEDRKEVLGKGSSTSALLLKNATNAMAPELRAAITHLFFNMSDKDATKFINNIGFGIASGYLMEHQIPIPPSATEGTADGPARPVNPITGQFIDAERPVDEPEWTEEEKEREAERLFVLFERYVSY